jgi:hypothetical protein
MPETWKTLFLRVLDKHAPVRDRKIKNKPNVYLGSLI